MAITLQPNDETATITRSSDGESTNETGAPGFPTIPSPSVTISIKGSSNSGSVTADDPGSATCTTALEWSKNSGGAWSTFDGGDVDESIVRINGNSGSLAGWSGATTATAAAGAVSDLSQILVRARVTIALVGGASTATGTATLTDWEISYEPGGSAIMEA